ncbi:phosphoribosylamine--glycine ligase, partial [bacterium]
MKVLVIGAGAREHALAWKLAQEADEVVLAPGNAGIAREFRCVAGDAFAVALAERPDLVVVGPEDPLIAGLADRLREEGLLVFGPGAEGARLEG